MQKMTAILDDLPVNVVIFVIITSTFDLNF